MSVMHEQKHFVHLFIFYTCRNFVKVLYSGLIMLIRIYVI